MQVITRNLLKFQNLNNMTFIYKIYKTPFYYQLEGIVGFNEWYDNEKMKEIQYCKHTK